MFRVYDEIDPATKRLYHSYQFLFIGDMDMATGSGYLNCKVISPTQVVIVMPVVAGVFVNDIKGLIRRLASKGKTTSAITKAHVTAARKYKSDASLQKIKVLVDFSRTGEQLDNSVWTRGSPPHGGNVSPRSCELTHLFTNKSKEKSSTLLCVGWLIARMEPEKRYGDVASSEEDNAVMNDLESSDDEGMKP